MIVCVCNNINEKQLDEAIEQKCRTSLEVWKYFDCQGRCAKCVPTIRKKVQEKVLTLAE